MRRVRGKVVVSVGQEDPGSFCEAFRDGERSSPTATDRRPIKYIARQL